MADGAGACARRSGLARTPLHTHSHDSAAGLRRPSRAPFVWLTSLCSFAGVLLRFARDLSSSIGVSFVVRRFRRSPVPVVI
jgi:hypothetical protein